MRILTFDTTLRDGTQGENVSYSVDDKLAIAMKLDELGIDYIEGGWPGANPKDTEFFKRYCDGIPIYDEYKRIVNKYAMVFLDGPQFMCVMLPKRKLRV
jgi:isopropylmalate/homocitrate/citramalate synthase